jgi:hypothetical protein
MTREQIIETMARGIDPYAWDADTIGEPARHSCRAKAERCLSALEADGLEVVLGPLAVSLDGETYWRIIPSGRIPAD